MDHSSTPSTLAVTSLGVFRVTGAQARDWEDISIGPGPQRGKSYLYIGDIGDNNEARSEIVVYRVAEPTLTAATAKFNEDTSRNN